MVSIRSVFSFARFVCSNCFRNAAAARTRSPSLPPPKARGWRQCSRLHGRERRYLCLRSYLLDDHQFRLDFYFKRHYNARQCLHILSAWRPLENPLFEENLHLDNTIG